MNSADILTKKVLDRHPAGNPLIMEVEALLCSAPKVLPQQETMDLLTALMVQVETQAMTIQKLNKELIQESARTAEATLRANQLNSQHSMLAARCSELSGAIARSTVR